MADRLGDSRSKAYALAGKIIVPTVFAPKPLNEFEILKRKAIRAASDTADAYIQNWTRWVIGWDESYRGRLNEARDAARELLEFGRLTERSPVNRVWVEFIESSSFNSGEAHLFLVLDKRRCSPGSKRRSRNWHNRLSPMNRQRPPHCKPPVAA
jgi:hypothetical protein